MTEKTLTHLAGRWIAIGSLMAMFSILLGAFGAHGLKPAFSEQQINWYSTAFEYHIIHSIALIITGFLRVLCKTTRWITIASWAFFVGILLFSGSLYILALTEIRPLGVFTPFGGIAFITGWVCLTLTGLNLAKGT